MVKKKIENIVEKIENIDKAVNFVAVILIVVILGVLIV